MNRAQERRLLRISKKKRSPATARCSSRSLSPVPRAEGRITIGRAAAAHFEELTARGYSPATIKHLENVLSALYRVGGLKSSSPLTSITQGVARRVMIEIRKCYSPGSAWQYGTKLIALFRAFTVRGFLLENPFATAVPPRKPKLLPGPTLTEDEIRKLLSAPRLSVPSGIRNRTVLEVFYATGMRLGELAGLEVGDLDFREGSVRVRGKGSKERTLPLGEAAATWLRKYLDRVRLRYATGTEKALWIGQMGRPVRPAWIQKMVRSLGRKAGIPKPVTPHTLRRTCATHLLRGGASAWVVKTLLGHSDAKTLGRYLMVDLKELRNAHEKTHPRA